MSTPVKEIQKYKNIPNRTEWIEYPDIEPLSKNLVSNLSEKPDGTPFYSLPVIHDPSTRADLAESFHIAEYLEKMYPAPSIFLHGTKSFHHAFQTSFGEKLGFPLYFILLRIFTQAWNTA